MDNRKRTTVSRTAPPLVLSAKGSDSCAQQAPSAFHQTSVCEVSFQTTDMDTTQPKAQQALRLRHSIDLGKVEMRIKEALQLQPPEEDSRPGSGWSVGKRGGGSLAARLREVGAVRVRGKTRMVETSKTALLELVRGKEEVEEEKHPPFSLARDTLPSSSEVLQSVIRNYRRNWGATDTHKSTVVSRKPTESKEPVTRSTNQPPSTLSQVSTAAHTRAQSLSLSPGKSLSPVFYQFSSNQRKATVPLTSLKPN